MVARNLYKRYRSNSKYHPPGSAMNLEFEPRDTEGVGASSCSAVVCEGGATLLKIPEALYNSVLRRTRTEQAIVVQTALNLWSLPLLRFSSFGTAVQAAKAAARLRCSYRTLLASFGSPLETVYVLVSGEVRVFAASSLAQRGQSLYEGSVWDQQSTAMPPLGSVNGSEYLAENSVAPLHLAEGSAASLDVTLRALLGSIAVLRPGDAVGGLELQKGLANFRFSYEVQTMQAEVLAMPRSVYVGLLREHQYNCGSEERNRTVLSDQDFSAMRKQRRATLKVLQRLKSEGGGSAGSCVDSDGRADLSAVGSLDSASAGLLEDFTMDMLPSVDAVASPRSPLRSNLGAVWVAHTPQRPGPRRHWHGEQVPESPLRYIHPSPRARGTVSPRLPVSSPRSQRSPRPQYIQLSSPRAQASCWPAADPVKGAAQLEKAEELTALRALPATVLARPLLPNPTQEYAASPAEAALNASKALDAIRARVKAKNQLSCDAGIQILSV
jgi:CRP-like cAMP-binding protein